jgi:hypothetical protein
MGCSLNQRDTGFRFAERSQEDSKRLLRGICETS